MASDRKRYTQLALQFVEPDLQRDAEKGDSRVSRRSASEQKAQADVRRPMGRNLDGADWKYIPADVVLSSIATAASRGGALRFGYTRDGGAYAVGVYGLGEYYTAYLRPGDDVPAFLRELEQAFADLPAPGADGK